MSNVFQKQYICVLFRTKRDLTISFITFTGGLKFGMRVYLLAELKWRNRVWI